MQRRCDWIGLLRRMNIYWRYARQWKHLSRFSIIPRLRSPDRATLAKPSITTYSPYCGATIIAADVVTRLIARYVRMAELRSLLETNFSGAYTMPIRVPTSAALPVGLPSPSSDLQ